MRRKRLLVTGASGFIGRRIVALAQDTDSLAEPFEYILTARKNHTIAGQAVQGLDFVELTDHQLAAFMRTEGPTHLLHSAWYTGDGFYQSPENISWLAHSARLFRAFLEAGGSAITTAGSCAEYAASPDVLHEDARTSDTTLYAAAKNALRGLQFAACSQYGARSTWGRLSFVYGPDEPPRKLLRSTAANLVANNAVLIREPQKRADFIHVHDAARGLLLLATSDNAAGIFNLCSGETPTLAEIVMQMRELCHSSSAITLGDLHAVDMRLNGNRAKKLGIASLIRIADGLSEIISAAAIHSARTR